MKFALFLLFSLFIDPAFAGEKESRLRRRAQDIQKQSMARISLAQFVSKNQIKMFTWKPIPNSLNKVIKARIGEGQMPNGDLCRVKLELRQGKFGGIKTERISIVSGVCKPKNGADPYLLKSVMLKQDMIEEENISAVRFYAFYLRQPSITERYGHKKKLHISDHDRGINSKSSTDRASSDSKNSGIRR